MPDFGDQLSALLQSPEAQQNLRTILSSFQQAAPPPEPPKEENPLQSILAQLSQSGFAPPSGGAIPPLGNLSTGMSTEGGIDFATVLKLQKIFSNMQCDDKNISLLKAVRPYLHDPQKVDGAIQMLRLMSVMPALSECGIFGGML